MLGDKEKITLRLNQRQMGLGGDNSWGAITFHTFNSNLGLDYSACKLLIFALYCCNWHEQKGKN